MGSTVFRIPSDVIKPSGYRPRVLYTSSGILNTVDPLASASNLYFSMYVHMYQITFSVVARLSNHNQGLPQACSVFVVTS